MGTGITDVRFVGRGEELAAPTAAYAAAAGERASLVVVGDAGVGKTRLLAEFTGGLDALVLRGGCLPLGATGLPFSPVVEVLRALAGEGGSPDGLPPVLAGLVPGHPAAPAAAPGSCWRRPMTPRSPSGRCRCATASSGWPGAPACPSARRRPRPRGRRT